MSPFFLVKCSNSTNPNHAPGMAAPGLCFHRRGARSVGRHRGSKLGPRPGFLRRSWGKIIYQWKVWEHIWETILENMGTNKTDICLHFFVGQKYGKIVYQRMFFVCEGFFLVKFDYPLIICYIAIEHGHRNTGFSH